MNEEKLPDSVSREKVSIDNIHIEPEIQGGLASAWINVEIDNHTQEDQLVVALVVVKLGEIQEKIEVVETIPPHGGVVEAVIRIEEPELWWPHGFGDQILYTCMVGLEVDEEIQDVEEQRFGVRSVRLLNEEEPLVLLLNGEEIPSTPDIWAPADQFVSGATEQRQRRLVEEARDAGAIMIRAWGEGFDEDKAFYDACDELGLLVWQELLPGAAGSPSDEFADVAAAEVGEHVKRLRNHPSIVAWCGSTESSKEAESRLLQHIIPSALSELDSTRPYLAHCQIPD